MKDKLVFAISRQTPFLGALSAVLLACGMGFTIVGGVKGALNQEAAAKAFWGWGTNSLLGGCLTLVVAAKSERYAARRWRMR